MFIHLHVIFNPKDSIFMFTRIIKILTKPTKQAFVFTTLTCDFSKAKRNVSNNAKAYDAISHTTNRLSVSISKHKQ